MDKIYCIKNKDNGLYMNINNKKNDAFNIIWLSLFIQRIYFAPLTVVDNKKSSYSHMSGLKHIS